MTSEPRSFEPWRSFLIGGLDKVGLLKLTESRCDITDVTYSMMTDSALKTQSAQEPMDTIILRPIDFGYVRARPAFLDLLDPIFLKRWSDENEAALGGRRVGLLPIDAGPHIRTQFFDQGAGERLYVASEPIRDASGNPGIFVLHRVAGGRFWLTSAHSYVGEGTWGEHDRIVYRLL